MNTARWLLGGTGTSTSAIGFGGDDPSDAVKITESWNGSSWTEVADLNTARYHLLGVGAHNTAALAVGGLISASPSALVELWNGSSWSENSDLSTSRGNTATAGATPAALVFGGQAPGLSAATEEWSGTSSTSKTISTD